MGHNPFKCGFFCLHLTNLKYTIHFFFNSNYYPFVILLLLPSFRFQILLTPFSFFFLLHWAPPSVGSWWFYYPHCGGGLLPTLTSSLSWWVLRWQRRFGKSFLHLWNINSYGPYANTTTQHHRWQQYAGKMVQMEKKRTQRCKTCLHSRIVNLWHTNYFILQEKHFWKVTNMLSKKLLCKNTNMFWKHVSILTERLF